MFTKLDSSWNGSLDEVRYVVSCYDLDAKGYNDVIFTYRSFKVSKVTAWLVLRNDACDGMKIQLMWGLPSKFNLKMLNNI